MQIVIVVVGVTSLVILGGTALMVSLDTWLKDWSHMNGDNGES